MNQKEIGKANYLYTESEKVPKIFGTFRNSSYLCNVKMKVLTIR